ncbi:hypothetical protein ACIGXA_30495 [Streptomyces fildesensis]|uniref:Uncharacterized protein n=1 Tax=Streptomyces fildesensis TaxID=375757 RepID=A0ABW8CEH1_9ACTN
MNIVLACLAGLLAAINLVQVVIGRQLIRPSNSKRPAPQLRRESACAAIAMIGVCLVALHIFIGLILIAIGFALIVIGRRIASKS